MVIYKFVFIKYVSEFCVKGLFIDLNLYCFFIGVGLFVGIDVLFLVI